MYYASQARRILTQKQKFNKSVDVLLDGVALKLRAINKAYVLELALFYGLSLTKTPGLTNTDLSVYPDRCNVLTTTNTLVMRMNTYAPGIPWVIHQNILLDLEPTSQMLKLFLKQGDCIKTVFYKAAREIKEEQVIKNMRRLVHKALS